MKELIIQNPDDRFCGIATPLTCLQNRNVAITISPKNVAWKISVDI